MVEKKMRQGKRRLMTKTRIDEISAVDFPAMEGARALLVKRRDGAEGDQAGAGDEAEKCGEYSAPITVVTTEENGHTHLLRIYGSERGGETSFARAPNSVEETDHAHPWSMDAEGNVTIGSNDGHTHAVSQRALVQSILALMKRAAKSNEPMPELAPELLDLVKVGKYPEDEDDGDTMTTKSTTTPDQGEVEKLRAELSVAKALAALTDAEKAFHNALPEGDRAGFLAKSADERKATVEAAARKASESDPVVYVSPVTKREYRRSAGEDMIELAKRADASETLAKANAEAAQNERCEKRAGTELSRYPGEIKVRAAIVKALEGIPDEGVRKAAFESIAAGNTALGGVFTKAGSTFGGSAPLSKDAAVAKLDELAKARQREKGGDFFDAYDAVKGENPELYRTAVTGA